MPPGLIAELIQAAVGQHRFWRPAASIGLNGRLNGADSVISA